jgi:hypothetical protein
MKWVTTIKIRVLCVVQSNTLFIATGHRPRRKHITEQYVTIPKINKQNQGNSPHHSPSTDGHYTKYEEF